MPAACSTTIQNPISFLIVWLCLALWAQLWQPRLLCSSSNEVLQSKCFILPRDWMWTAINFFLSWHVGWFTRYFFNCTFTNVNLWFVYRSFPDGRLCLSCELPIIKTLCWLAVSSEIELLSSRPTLLPLCWNMGVCLPNSCVYHSQQAVIFPNREIIALQAAKGTQVCQAWMGWTCPALWYSICSSLHGLCVFLLWPSPVPRRQGEEGHKAAGLERDVSLWHLGKDANVLCLLLPSSNDFR